MIYSEAREKKERMLRNFFDDVEPLMDFFNDSELTDIYINQENEAGKGGQVVVESNVKGKVFTDVYLSEEKVTAIIQSAASLFNWTINPNDDVPKVEGVLPAPYRFRFTGMLPPASPFPCIALRRPSGRVFSIEDYLANHQMSQEQYDVICSTIKNRGNIIVGGSTGSGKTTFTNAVIKKMVEYTPNDRFYIVEDVQELVCPARDKVMLLASHPESSASVLVQESLRFTPDRIIFGELRYPQVAYDLVTAWNTGHTGCVTTLHANDCASMLTRLNKLCNDKTGNDLGQINWPDILSLCVHLKKTGGKRIIDEIKVIK